MFTNQTIVVGVTGGIAAYKVCTLVSMLRKAHASVRVVMTPHAAEFVSPLTFETLSANPVTVETFDPDRSFEVEHVALAAQAKLFVVAPATGNFLGKYASGIADDFLTTTAMSMSCPVLVCPAMNFRMMNAAATSENVDKLARRGVHILLGKSGFLACGEEGDGRMAEPAEIFDAIKELLLPKRDLVGKRVLITSGATREDVDGVRCITNYSSGKMGAALADAAARRGAAVTVVEGFATNHPTVGAVVEHVNTTTEMYDAVMRLLPDQDIIIKAAAPSDYRPSFKEANKLKGEHVRLELIKNPDIAAAVGAAKRADQRLVIFCAETENLLENARAKLEKKRADMVVANDVTYPGAGFETDTNVVTILGKNFQKETGIKLKTVIADDILDCLHDC